MYNIHINFNKILEVVKDFIGDEVDKKSNNLRRDTKPKFSDIELKALSLKPECLFIDSEYYLFSKLNYEYLNDFENLISRRLYNDRRKLRFGKTVTLGKSLAAGWQWKAQSDAGATTCNEQPELLLNDDLQDESRKKIAKKSSQKQGG